MPKEYTYVSSSIYITGSCVLQVQTIRSPPWLRMLQIVFGSIAVLLSVVILLFLVIFPGIALLTLILFMSLVLLVVGIERIAIGLSPISSRKTRIIDIVLGLVVIGISIFLMQFPILTSVSLVILGAVALMIGGIARIVQGISREIPKFSKGLIIGIGALSVAISIAIIANPITLGLVLLVIMLAVTLLIAGIEMIYLGLRGIKKANNWSLTSV
jgi:uncharacterized membrane protein HdeD (DUF308 family)